jgi:hypothetical protein
VLPSSATEERKQQSPSVGGGYNPRTLNATVVVVVVVALAISVVASEEKSRSVCAIQQQKRGNWEDGATTIVLWQDNPAAYDILTDWLTDWLTWTEENEVTSWRKKGVIWMHGGNQ